MMTLPNFRNNCSLFIFLAVLMLCLISFLNAQAQIMVPGMCNPTKTMIDATPKSTMDDLKVYARINAKGDMSLIDTAFKLATWDGKDFDTHKFTVTSDTVVYRHSGIRRKLGKTINELFKITGNKNDGCGGKECESKKPYKHNFINGFSGRKWFYGFTQDANLISKVSNNDTTSSAAGSFGFSLTQLVRTKLRSYGEMPYKLTTNVVPSFSLNILFLVASQSRSLNADLTKSGTVSKTEFVGAILNPYTNAKSLRNVVLSSQFFPFAALDKGPFIRNLGISGFYSATGMNWNISDSVESGKIKIQRTQIADAVLSAWGVYFIHRSISFINTGTTDATIMPYIGLTGRAIGGLAGTSYFSDARYELLHSRQTYFIGYEGGIQFLINSFRAGASISYFQPGGTTQNNGFYQPGISKDKGNYMVEGLHQILFQINMAASLSQMFSSK